MQVKSFDKECADFELAITGTRLADQDLHTLVSRPQFHSK